MSPIAAQSEMPAFDDEIILARFPRPGGTIILAPVALEDAVESWTGQVAEHVTARQAVEQAPLASPMNRVLCIGAQFSQGLRADLVAKGYTVTAHGPAPALSPYGGVLCQSEMPAFDDEITLA